MYATESDDTAPEILLAVRLIKLITFCQHYLA